MQLLSLRNYKQDMPAIHFGYNGTQKKARKKTYKTRVRGW